MRCSILAAILCISLLSGCGSSQQQAAPPSAPAAPTGPPAIAKLVPDGTIEKRAFQVQADGKSAISVEGANFTHGSAVVANGIKLNTAFGNAGWVSAEVPPEIFAKAGGVAIKVVNPDGRESNSVEFRVAPQQ